MNFSNFITVAIYIVFAGMCLLYLGIYMIRHAEWKGDELLLKGRIYMSVGIIAIVGCVFFGIFASKRDMFRDPSWYIERGYTVYLDGVEVDADKINVNAYRYKVDDAKKYLLLSKN